MSMGTLGLKGMASLVPNDDELDKRIRNYMLKMSQKDVFFLFFSLKVHPKVLLLGVHQGFWVSFAFCLYLFHKCHIPSGLACKTVESTALLLGEFQLSGQTINKTEPHVTRLFSLQLSRCTVHLINSPPAHV